MLAVLLSVIFVEIMLFAGLFYLRLQMLQGLRQQHAAKGQVKAAQKAHQLLIDHVVHEQRNPLHVCTNSIEFVITSLQELQRTRPHSHLDSIVRDAAVVQAQTERMHRLVNDLLNLSKLQSRRLGITITIQPTNLRQILVQTANAFASMSKVPIYFHCASTVPGLVMLDGLRLQQIISNGMSNACKMTETGHICINAHVRLRPTHPKVSLENACAAIAFGEARTRARAQHRGSIPLHDLIEQARDVVPTGGLYDDLDINLRQLGVLPDHANGPPDSPTGGRDCSRCWAAPDFPSDLGEREQAAQEAAMAMILQWHAIDHEAAVVSSTTARTVLPILAQSLPHKAFHELRALIPREASVLEIVMASAPNPIDHALPAHELLHGPESDSDWYPHIHSMHGHQMDHALGVAVTSLSRQTEAHEHGSQSGSDAEDDQPHQHLQPPWSSSTDSDDEDSAPSGGGSGRSSFNTASSKVRRLPVGILEPHLVIRIVDTGVGLGHTQERRSAAVRKDQTTPSHTAWLHGAGIGVTFATQLARAMGGTVTLRNETRLRRTCFEVTIPLRPPWRVLRQIPRNDTKHMRQRFHQSFALLHKLEYGCLTECQRLARSERSTRTVMTRCSALCICSKEGVVDSRVKLRRALAIDLTRPTIADFQRLPEFDKLTQIQAVPAHQASTEPASGAGAST